MAGGATTLARTPITFETADGARQHAPLILAAVGGVTTRLVLDTGSEVHLLARELVDRLGLAFEEGGNGTDHGGEAIPSWAVEDVALDLGDLAVTLADVVAIPAPPPFPGWGIGGILSPQHLHPRAYTVVDLAADELLCSTATTRPSPRGWRHAHPRSACSSWSDTTASRAWSSTRRSDRTPSFRRC